MINFSKSWWIVLLFPLFQQCSPAANKKSANEVPDSASVLLAAKTIKGNCNLCHAGGGTAAIAPNWTEIKEAYIGKYQNAGEFTKAMIGFLAKPDVAASLMPESVERFGLMPAMSLDEATAKAIAEFIYHYQPESEAWISALNAGITGGEVNYLALGKDLALQTKAVLGKNLMEAIKTRGSAGAVEFCNTRAIPLTDSMAIALHASIKRVSDKPRNLKNAADSAQMAVIGRFKSALANGEKMKPEMLDLGNKIRAFYPIETGEMCLQCHGSIGKDINEETLKAIKTRYPEDRAIGYAENQVRGMWVVEMDKGAD